MRFSGFVCFIFSLLSVLYNVRSGLGLSESKDLSADDHLMAAILTLVFILLGAFFSSRVLSKRQEALRHASLEDETRTKDLKNFESAQENLYFLMIGSGALSVISLITGTISYAGSFPWLHGVLGFALLAGLIGTLTYSVKLFLQPSS